MAFRFLASVSLIVSFFCSAVPGRVSDFSTSKSIVTSGDTITLTWHAPSGATHFNLYAKKPGDSYTIFRNGITSTSTTRLVGKRGVHYLRVQACDAFGCGAFSTLSVTAYDVPGIPAQLKASDSTVIEGEHVLLSWSSPTGYTDPVRFNLDILKPNYTSYFRRLSFTSATNFNRLIGVAGQHTIRVNACNLDGQCGSFRTIVVSAYSPPSPPVSINAELINEGHQLRVHWIPGLSSQKTDVEIRVGNDSWEKQNTTGNERIYHVANFSRHGSRSFRARSCNGEICSAYIYAPESIETLRIPSPVSVFTASNYSVLIGNDVLLQWQSAESLDQGTTYNLDVKKPWDSVYYRKLSNTDRGSFERYIGAVGEHHFRVNVCNALGVCSEYKSLSLIALGNNQCSHPDEPTLSKNTVVIGRGVEAYWSLGKYSECYISQPGLALTEAVFQPQICTNSMFDRSLLRFFDIGRYSVHWVCSERDSGKIDNIFLNINVTKLTAPNLTSQ